MCISRRFMVSRPYPAFPSLQHASGDQLAGVQEGSLQMPSCNCRSLKPQLRDILIKGLCTVCCACRALLSF